MDPPQKHEKIQLVEINSYLTCYLCKGYLIDATTISECLHSFCRSCIIKFLQENCYCPVCEVIINKAKPCLKLDKTLQDIVYKLVPGLFVKEMFRRKEFYQSRPSLAPKVSPEERGEDTERTIFNPLDAISLSIEYISDDSAPGAIPSLSSTAVEEAPDHTMKRYLQCPGMCRIEVLKKFVRNKYNVDTYLFHIDILYKRVPLPDHYTLIDIGYIYSWKRNAPMKFFFRITDINKVAERFDYFDGSVTPEIVEKPPPLRVRHSLERASTKSDKKKETTSHEVKCEKKKDEVRPVRQGKGEAVKSHINGMRGDKSETPGKNAVNVALASVTPGKSDAGKVTASKNAALSSVTPGKCYATNVTPGKNDAAKVTPGKNVTLSSVTSGKCYATKVTPGKNVTSSSVTPGKCYSANVTSGKNDITKVTPSKNVTLSSVTPGKYYAANVTPGKNDAAKVTPGKNVALSSVTSGKCYAANVTPGKNDAAKVTPPKNVAVTPKCYPAKVTAGKVTPGKTVTTCKNKAVTRNDLPGKSAVRNDRQVRSARQTKNSEKTNNKQTQNEVKGMKSGKQVILKPEITEEIKNKIQSEKRDGKNSVYTNITLNREDNVEIITKIQKVSNKEGLPIGLNIINHTVKKTNKVQNNDKSDAKLVPSSSNDNIDNTPERTKALDLEKSNFLKSIELTAKSPVSNEKKDVKLTTPVVPPAVPSSSSSSSSAQKRKNSSPMKNEKSHEKKPRIEKKPMKIIIQPKTIPNPAVRQMVTNVNQNVNNVSKIVEQSTTQKTDLQSLIDNCKINIPASLSITLNETSDSGARTPPSIPPVKNFIEILKLPDKETKDKSGEKDRLSPTLKDNNRNIPTFQKIFEESIVKKSPTSKVEGAKQPLDLTSPSESLPPKRKILEIASQLQKKTKFEQEKKEESLPKIAIPRLATQRTLRPASSGKCERPQNAQNSATLHSPTLGLNYTVSVGQGDPKSTQEARRPTPSSSKAAKSKNSAATAAAANGVISSPKNLTPNQLLEKYNIQNLAQLTASFNFNHGSYGALQQAMLLKQMEHHSWLNQGPLLQFEKYMQSLSAAQSKMMGNVKEN